MISEIRIPAKHYLATLCLRFLLKNMDNKTSLEWLLRGLNVLVHIKCSELCQVAGKHLAIIIVAIIIALLAVIKKRNQETFCIHLWLFVCHYFPPSFAGNKTTGSFLLFLSYMWSQTCFSAYIWSIKDFVLSFSHTNLVLMFLSNNRW